MDLKQTTRWIGILVKADDWQGALSCCYLSCQTYDYNILSN
jgi:hypothetical protein